MSLPHAILGLLALEPTTGYELTQRFERSLSHAWHASHSQIYPELSRLEAQGMVEVVAEGSRRSRTWAVTDAGGAELRRWLTEENPVRHQRNPTALRWFLLSLLDAGDRRMVLERELAHVRAEADRLRAVAEDIDRFGRPDWFRATVDLGLRIDAVTVEWLSEQLAALEGPG